MHKNVDTHFGIAAMAEYRREDTENMEADIRNFLQTGMIGRNAVRKGDSHGEVHSFENFTARDN